ncbi:MAG: hypothetical protein LGB07_01530 [Sulfurovum sp.]|nr:hypothetical protein [Sulfurovum sp.]MCB4744325.1 hypothetical protein [Sulfurovum sp.]MCB4746322.1 hypothetical protein [Sulfurovum sp.]MCB4748572.1 hypothetical protein [Sulfurovum sp.]MCB4750970.1 hypothetical protein [Sulfurovum sp.]
MRFKSKTLHFIINFLLGVSWATMLTGMLTAFLAFYENSLFFAIISALMSAIPGLLGILLLEYFIINKEKLEEIKKQTELLKRLVEKRGD